MSTQYFFNLDSIKPQKNNEAGSITYVTSKEVSGFSNISFINLKLNKNGVIEPIWHPNASKIGYCLEGNFLISIRTPTTTENFTVKPGEIFFIPQGYVHHIENSGETAGTLNFALNNTNPETMHFSEAVRSLSENVFNSTFNTPAHFVEGLKKSKENNLLKIVPGLKKASSSIENRFKFDIDKSNKVILTKGGYLQIGTKATLPTLQGLGILGFGLNPKGIVEPHWHTNAGELVYIVKGKTRITLLSPNGKVEVLEVNGGQGAFAPASYFHNIENIGSDEVKVIAFFSHHEPDYIGIGEVLGSYSNELLASVFSTASNYFDTLKKPEKPLVIVPV